jgi:hypothetical protein
MGGSPSGEVPHHFKPRSFASCSAFRKVARYVSSSGVGVNSPCLIFSASAVFRLSIRSRSSVLVNFWITVMLCLSLCLNSGWKGRQVSSFSLTGFLPCSVFDCIRYISAFAAPLPSIIQVLPAARLSLRPASY